MSNYQQDKTSSISAASSQKQQGAQSDCGLNLFGDLSNDAYENRMANEQTKQQIQPNQIHASRLMDMLYSSNQQIIQAITYLRCKLQFIEPKDMLEYAKIIVSKKLIFNVQINVLVNSLALLNDCLFEAAYNFNYESYLVVAEILNKENNLYHSLFDQSTIQVHLLQKQRKQKCFTLLLQNLDKGRSIWEAMCWLFHEAVSQNELSMEQKPLYFIIGSMMPQLIASNIAARSDLRLLQGQIHALPKEIAQKYLFVLTNCSVRNQFLLKEYTYPTLKTILWSSSIQKRVMGIKSVLKFIDQDDTQVKQSVIKWLEQEDLVRSLLKEGNHNEVLKKTPKILGFLYRNNRLRSEYILQLVQKGEHASKDLLEVICQILNFLNLQHLGQAFQVISRFRQFHTNNAVCLLSHLSQSLQRLKCQKNHSYLEKLSAQQIKQQKETELNQNKKTETKKIKQEQPKWQKLLIKVINFLGRLIEEQQDLYIGLFNFMLTENIGLLGSYIDSQILNLLRNNKTVGFWVLEHLLRTEERKKPKEAIQQQYLSKLAHDGLYEYLFALLARHRYNKAVVDKSLSCVILLSRIHRPIEKVKLEFLWKVLGIMSSNEKEREEYFGFVRQALRFKNTFSQEAVIYVYFDVMLRLEVEWFTVRNYQCLELLFMRINEDLGLTYYQDKYVIIDDEMVGLEKIWYVYFNSKFPKVQQKSKEFLCKLSSYDNKRKKTFLKKYIQSILGYLSGEKATDKQARQIEYISKGIQMLKGLILKSPFEASGDQKIILILVNETKEALQPRKMQIEVEESMTLAELKAKVTKRINPPVDKIELTTKGAKMCGQHLTLSELNVTHKNTILVQNEINEPHPENRQLIKDILEETYSDGFIDYVVTKAEGERIDKIMNLFLDQDSLDKLQQQYKKCQEKKQSGKCKEGIGLILSEQLADVLHLISYCMRDAENFESCWQLVKQLPLNPQATLKLDMLMKESQRPIQKLLAEKDSFSPQELLYYAYTLKHYFIGIQPDQRDQLFEKKLCRRHLTEWLFNLEKNCSAIIKGYVFMEIVQILLLKLRCPFLALYSRFQTESITNICQQITKLMQMPDQLPYQSFFGSKQLSQLLLSLPKETQHLGVVQACCKLLMLGWYYHQNQFCYLLKLDFQSTKYKILKFGKCFEFIALIQLAASKNSQKLSAFRQQIFSESAFLTKEQRAQYDSLNYFNFLCQAFQFQGLKPQCNTFLLKVMKKIKEQIGLVKENQLIGLLEVAKAQKSLGGNEEEEFIAWLFDNYLFGLQSHLPFFRNSNLRKRCYQLLLSLCQHKFSMQKLVNLVVSNGLVTNKQENINIDFRDSGFIGLKNLGATCYINSTLQQLYHTKLSKMLLEKDQETEEQKKMIMPLRRLFIKLNKSIGNVVNPRNFIQSIKFYGETIKTAIQQDASEFLSCLLQHIENAGCRAITDQVFGGTFRNEIVSLEEKSKFTKISHQHFYSYPVDIKGHRSLPQALAFMAQEHILDGDNRYLSDSGERLRASRTTLVQKFPNILIITLKRFYFCYESYTRHKLNDYFQFSMQVDLEKVAVPQSKGNAKYQLVGILIHSGSAEAGHYYSYIKVEDKWYEFNDSLVREINLQNYLKSNCYGSSQISSLGQIGTTSAYLLFYQKIGVNYHGTFLSELTANNPAVQQIKQQNKQFLKSRLTYQPNYMQFVEHLSQINDSPELKTITEKLLPKKTTVYFDCMDETEKPTTFEEDQCPLLNDYI